MNNAVRRAMDAWGFEVDAEMVRLIEAGVPPYDAADQAREIVSKRRRNTTTDTTTGGK